MCGRSGEILRFLNADPDSALRDRHDGSLAALPLGEDVAIVGAGNVAMDVARLLCRSTDALSGRDIDDETREMLGTSAIRHIDIVARCSRDRVRWDHAMFSELCS